MIMCIDISCMIIISSSSSSNSVISMFVISSIIIVGADGVHLLRGTCFVKI